MSETTITGSYSDTGGSGIAYYGYNSSMTGSSSLTESINSTGTYTFYVKDGVGNKTSCSIDVISTIPNTYCKNWGDYYCDDGGMTACGNKTCCNDAGGTWKRDCTGGYGKTYYCDSGYTKINDKYCYIKK